MSTKATGNKKHLTLADRAAIEHGISCGEILLRLPTGSTRILPPYPRRSDGIFSGFLIFKMKPSGNARNVSIIRTVKNSISVGIRLVIPYAGNAAPSAAPCIVRTLLPGSATG